MTVAAPLLPGQDLDQVTVGVRPWWIPDESPGGLGDPEIWVDGDMLDMYARGHAEPAVSVRPERGARMLGLFGALVRFERHGADLESPAVYKILGRRWSLANGGRPYYVLKWPD